MKGSIKIELSQAAMIEALQQYFDKQFAEGCAPKVEGVATASGGSSYSNGDFSVTCTGEKV